MIHVRHCFKKYLYIYRITLSICNLKILSFFNDFESYSVSYTLCFCQLVLLIKTFPFYTQIWLYHNIQFHSLFFRSHWHISPCKLLPLLCFIFTLWPYSLCICVLSPSVLSDCEATDCSPPDFSVYGIIQARILEWVAITYFRESLPPKDQTHISCATCIDRKILYHQATWEVHQFPERQLF